jgi:hypothetical protein
MTDRMMIRYFSLKNTLDLYLGRRYEISTFLVLFQAWACFLLIIQLTLKSIFT